MRGRKNLQKRRDALNLRLAGASYRDIAHALGYADGNPGDVYKMVQDELNAVTREPAKELRQMELQRLDQMQQGLWSEARTGDPEAVRTVLRIMELRARYYGLPAANPQVVVNQNLHQQLDTEAVIVIPGESKESYIRGLRAARGEVEQPALPPPRQRELLPVQPDLEVAVPASPGGRAQSDLFRNGSVQESGLPEGEVSQATQAPDVIDQ